MHANATIAYVAAPIALIAAFPAIASGVSEKTSGKALGLDRAIKEFGLACLRTYPDKSRMEYLLKRSDLAYEPLSASGEWRSESVTISDLGPSEGAPHCAFEAFVSAQDVSSVDVATAIERNIKSELGMAPRRQIHEAGLVWKWQADGKLHTVTQYYAKPIRKQQLVLSYRISSSSGFASR